VERKASFTCQLCGKEAGSIAVIDNDHVRLHGLNDRTESANSSAFKAIDNSDARALYLLNEEYVTLYCPRCDCFYCKEHWNIRILLDDGFYDATYGECPAGHERRMDD
jgi:hypothetical protein